MLIEKLESQLEARDLIKLELNGNLAPDSIALYLLKAPICLVSECSAPLCRAKNLVGFSEDLTDWFGFNHAPLPGCERDENNNVKSLRGWEVSKQREPCICPSPEEPSRSHFIIQAWSLQDGESGGIFYELTCSSGAPEVSVEDIIL